VSKRETVDIDRRVLRSTRGFFEGRSTALVALLGLAFIAVVGVLDYLTGPNISLSLLYLMPIGLVTWNLGRRWGAVTVVVATVVGIASDVLSDPQLGATRLLPYWDAVVRFAVFLAFAMLLDTLKEIIDDQWTRVEKETERSGDLRELNAQKDTLLHAVSHDLKSPLAGILGAMQTIRRDNELHLTFDERESLYEVIEQSGRKIDRLIDDLLDLDRIDRGQLRPQRKPTDVGELARRVIREGTGFGAHPVRVEADPVEVEVDPARVERIIDNLLLNATRHTPPGTPIYVFVRSRTDGVTLVVEDEGPGVPDELKQVLFEPFRQGESSSGRGVGIGLSLVERFAEIHGGSARIEDREGGGARFVVDLPGRVLPLNEASVDAGERSPHALAGSPT
jgi:signal transduction histidine kinase